MNAEHIAEGPSLVTQCFAGIDPEPIDWLWRGRIARGKVTIFVGDPGLGKSVLTVDMAARITRRKPWPVDGDKAPIGDVLILSGEDDPADTIRPRLDAAGADVRRVHLLKGTRDTHKDGKLRQRQFSLKRDIPFLSAELDKRRYALVVIDPVSAYLDGTDSHNNAEVRGLLTPLSDLASAHKVAIVCVTHFNKGGSLSALYRTMGSIAFVGQARAVWTVTKDPNDPDGRRRFFVCSKANLAPEPTGLAYCVKPSLANPEIPLIEWEPEPVDVSIENAMYHESEEVRSELQEVREWLTDMLSGGPVEAKEVRRFAKDDGHAWATVRCAQYALGVKPRKRDFTGGWVWELPPPKMLKPRASHDEHLEHLRVKPEKNTYFAPLKDAEDVEDAQGNQGRALWTPWGCALHRGRRFGRPRPRDHREGAARDGTGEDMNTAELLDEVTRRRIKLEPDGDALCYTAPKNVLTPALLAELKTHKPELLQVLGHTPKRCYGVFEYRRVDSERWLTLFSIRPGDTARLLERDLSARFGCVVEVREKGDPA